VAVVDDKILARVERLLRLAAPSSNTTLQEREVAAVEAARLIEEHDLVLTRRERRGRASREREREASGRRPRAAASDENWSLRRVQQHTHCSFCSGLISPGDVVWFNSTSRRSVHNYDPCYSEAQVEPVPTF